MAADQSEVDLLALGRRLRQLRRSDPRQLERLLLDAQHNPALLRLYERAADAAMAAERAERWLRDPVAWANDCVAPAAALHDYQERDLAKLNAEKRLAVRSLHGAGKTRLASAAIWWFATTREALGINWKIPTTASVWRQLQHFLWPEVHKFARYVRWDVMGRPAPTMHELLSMQIKMRYGAAWAMASKDAAAIEGAHAEHLLYVFDEAKTIPVPTWDAAEGAFSGAGAGEQMAWWLSISTPGEPAGRFHDIQTRKRGLEDWATSRVTLEDAIRAGRVSAEWAEQRRRMWGESSPVYQQRVLGNFASSGRDVVIPLAWVEAANERWWAMAEERTVMGHTTHVGIDVGRTSDQSVFASLAGDFVARPVRPGHGDSKFVASAALPYVGTRQEGPLVVVDADGIGSGVYDELHSHPDLGRRVRPFHAGGKPEYAEGVEWTDATGELHFANRRAAAWWHLRDLLDPRLGATLALPDDDLLVGDLTARAGASGQRDRILIESKEEIEKRIGRSTDTADAVVMAAWGRLLSAIGTITAEAHENREFPLVGDVMSIPV